MKNPLVVGLHGLPGAGKDTVANHMIAAHGFIKMAFADKLKDELVAAFNVKRALFDEPSLKTEPTVFCALVSCIDADFVEWYVQSTEGQEEIAKNADFTQWNVHLTSPRTPRWLMQRWGDWRRSQTINYFIEALRAKIDAAGSAYIVVTDVRFDNEAKLVTSYNRHNIWWVRRLQAEMNLDSHVSNKTISKMLIDRVIQNNDSLHNLNYQVTYAVDKINANSC
jgi:hypothetical protein